MRNPDAQPHSINLAAITISEADGFSLTSLWAGKYSDSYHWLWRELSTPRGYAMSGIYAVRTPGAALLESYEICPIPEVVLAAPEDLVDSAQRLSEVCQWRAEAAPT